ncbi:MAG: hypothetical protein K0R57_280 [Paenibacillaceae bacterium]|jgi:Xaa-Pro aminopeptidase|nr:hypothetical protein [Paenibacillaceae bacterium]
MNIDLLSKKLAAVRHAMNRCGWDALVLTQQKNISWLTEARSHINLAAELACCTVIVTPQQCFLLSSNIEAERMTAEEIGGGSDNTSIIVHQWPWHEPDGRLRAIGRLTAGYALVMDDCQPSVELELSRLRTHVEQEEQEAWKRLGRLAAGALESVALELKQGQSELEIGGAMTRQCLERELEAIVVLVAADDRVRQFRHPLPTPRKLASYAMLVLGARSKGRIVSCTRLVHFGPPSPDLIRKHISVAEIDARIMSATRPGRTLGDMYALLEICYLDAGFPAEIGLHHQGGLTGYMTREQLALPNVERRIAPNQVYAWNPSITGVKSEDTMLLDGTGSPLILTHTGNYPSVEILLEGRRWSRPGILIR